MKKVTRNNSGIVMLMMSIIGAFVLMSGVLPCDGGTIGYWRFEDSPGFLSDSSDNHFTLVAEGPTHYTLPGSGNGANFDDPIRRTGEANAKAASFDGGDYFDHADAPEFAVSNFTVEAYICTTGTSWQAIASQFDYGANRSWVLYVEGGYLRVKLSENGNDNIIISSGLSLAQATDYYIAMSFDQSQQTGGLKFYRKTLSTGAWRVATKDHTITSLHDGTPHFRIGNIAAGSGLWQGVIDEVRWSDKVLARDELLVYSPHRMPIGYWRFEDSPGFLSDSSDNNFTLVAEGPTHYTLPGSGNGANFDDPIRQTGEANAKAASFDGGDYFRHLNVPEFVVSDFTLEAYICTTSTVWQAIASQYDVNSYSWRLYVESGQLQVRLSENGTTTITIASGLSISTETDYYIAMSFDQSQQTGGLKFYRKTLSTGEWQEATKNHTITSLYNSDDDFRIGNIASGSGLWRGVIDEVRWSGIVLEKNQLLASSPAGTVIVVQ